MKINDQELTEEQTNKLKECLPELFPSKYKPKHGEEYCYVSNSGRVFYKKWSNEDTIGNDIFSIGNVFSTKEEAEEEIKYRKALTTIKHYILDNFGEWKPDWEDEGQSKYFIYYDHTDKRFDYNGSYFFQEIMPSFLYLQSDGQCEQLIKDCETELKIVCGVE